ncbi:MAG: MFS transporter [Pseudomonadota bacterium]
MKNPLPYSRNQIIVLLACVGVFALGQFHRASGSVFTPILIDRFSLSAAAVSGLVSSMFFATIVSQIPFGAVLDRIGPRIVLTWCVFLIAFGTAIFALNYTFELAFLSRILIGIGLASMGAATHIIIARNFDAGDFGYISGMVVTLGGIGGLLGTYPLAFALERVPWVFVFGIVALVSVILAFGIFAAVEPGTADADTNEEASRTDGYFSLLGQSEFLKILALGVVTYAPIVTITGLWGGPYLQDIAKFSVEGAGAVLLLLFSSTIVAGYIFGVLDKKLRSRQRLILVSVGFSVFSLLALVLLDQPNAYLVVFLLAVMVFFQQFYIPLGAHMRKSVPDNILGRASTLLSLVSVAAIPAMQLGFGAILDFSERLGLNGEDQYKVAFATMAGLILVCGTVYSTSREANDNHVD